MFQLEENSIGSAVSLELCGSIQVFEVAAIFSIGALNMLGKGFDSEGEWKKNYAFLIMCTQFSKSLVYTFQSVHLFISSLVVLFFFSVKFCFSFWAAVPKGTNPFRLSPIGPLRPEICLLWPDTHLDHSPWIIILFST